MTESVTIPLAIVAAALTITALAYLRFPRFRDSIKDNIPHYLTALFTFALVVFACYAWLESRRSSAALEGQLNAMKLDQRPFLWIINIYQPVYVDASRQFRWSWAYANIGKGVAYQLVTREYLKIGSEHYRPSHHVGANPEIQQPSAPTTLPPIPVSIIHQYSTAGSQPGIDKDFFNTMMNTDRGIGLLVDFVYSDASGKTVFTTSICIERLASGAFSNQRPEDCVKEQ